MPKLVTIVEKRHTYLYYIHKTSLFMFIILENEGRPRF
jgi:hypothetical protein